MVKEDVAEKKVIETFAGVASALGYSDLHGRILAVLLVENQPVSLQEIAHKTNYSLSTISLSIDFLEILGVIKKVKRNSDRKVYVRLDADLLDCLKKAVIVKVQASIASSLSDFDAEKKRTKDKKLKRTINVLENEIKRLQSFMDKISKIEIPKR